MMILKIYLVYHNNITNNKKKWPPNGNYRMRNNFSFKWCSTDLWSTRANYVTCSRRYVNDSMSICPMIAIDATLLWVDLSTRSTTPCVILTSRSSSARTKQPAWDSTPSYASTMRPRPLPSRPPCTRQSSYACFARYSRWSSSRTRVMSISMRWSMRSQIIMTSWLPKRWIKKELQRSINKRTS